MSSIESSKSMALIGSLLLLIGGFVPWAGFVLTIIGVFLLLSAIKGFSTYYQDPAMYDNAFKGFIYYIIAAIAFAVAFGLLIAGFVSIFFIAIGIIGFIAALVVAFIFYIMAAKRLRTTLNDLAQKTGEHSFETAGMLLWWGAILTIIFIGGILIFIAWIFVIIGFISMKTPGQPVYQQQPYGYTPTPPPTQAPTRFCPNCGAQVQPGQTFCPNCGKPLPPS
jgi:uncharacterized membrane protein